MCFQALFGDDSDEDFGSSKPAVVATPTPAPTSSLKVVLYIPTNAIDYAAKLSSFLFFSFFFGILILTAAGPPGL